jgi:hypothetical protein
MWGTGAFCTRLSLSTEKFITLWEQVKVTITKERVKRQRVEDIGKSSTHPVDTCRPPPSTDKTIQQVREIVMYKGNFTVDKKSMLVPIQINGIQVFAVVDSGAQVSIINKDLYNQILDKPKITETVFIKGINSTASIRAHIVPNINIKIGRTNLQWNMLMAEITEKVILGLDFLEANKAIVDHGQYSIHINGEMIHATFALNEQEEHLQMYRAKIDNTTVIPPFSMKFIETKLNLKPKEDIMIQPSSQLDKVLSPNALCSNEDTTFLMVWNPTDKNVTLKKNKSFGQGVEVQNIIGNEQIESCLDIIPWKRT